MRRYELLGATGTKELLDLYILDLGYRKQLDDVLKNRLNSILEGLVKVEKEHSIISKKVAIGYGACIDLFVDGSDLLNYEAVADIPEHFNDISSSDELLKSYAYFYRYGAAAERYMSNSTLFDELVLSAYKSHTSHHSVGGNAPVMASRFLSEGCHVLLAAKMTTELQKTLPEGITGKLLICPHKVELTPFQTLTGSQKNLKAPEIEPGASGSVARNSDHYITEAAIDYRVTLKNTYLVLY
uniref:Uncharacterized protein n=1 Tax=Timema cristinae TaxID=61476 RepID=A0A7R9D2E8_TIMCR|nr:unnamed protein product [Timema cristinae]